VITAPTSTTNITGFFISVRGFNFTNESQHARLAISASQIDLLFFVWAVMFSFISESLSRIHQQVLQDRAKAERGEKSQRPYDQDHGNQQTGE
jgi:hypothetical protein